MFVTSVRPETDLFKIHTDQSFYSFAASSFTSSASLPPFVGELHSDHPTLCLPLALTFAPYQVSNDATCCGKVTHPFQFPRLPVQIQRKGAIHAVNLRNTSVSNKEPPSQRPSGDSPAHLWFINWWFITQRHIGNANVSTVVLFSPDVKTRRSCGPKAARVRKPLRYVG